MYNDLSAKFTIENGYCIATEVVEHDRTRPSADRQYPTFTLEGEEIVKYNGKHYRHRRFIDNEELKKLGITEQDIIRSCQGPIKILKKSRN